MLEAGSTCLPPRLKRRSPPRCTVRPSSKCSRPRWGPHGRGSDRRRRPHRPYHRVPAQAAGSRVVVYEASDRIGGAIKSERRDGYLAELGPSSLAAPSGHVPGLLSDLGLDSRGSPPRLTAADTGTSSAAGRLMRLPMSPAELLTSRLLSNVAKLAIFGEPLVEAGDSPSTKAWRPLCAGASTRKCWTTSSIRSSPGSLPVTPSSCRYATPCRSCMALERTHGSVMKALVQMMKAHESKPGPVVRAA